MVTVSASGAPVRVAPAEDWVTESVWAPDASVAPAVAEARPIAPRPWAITNGPPATAVVRLPTEPAETAAPAVATERTVKVVLPGVAVALVVAVARAAAEDAAVVEVQAEAWVMLSGTRAAAAVCSVVRLLLRACSTPTIVWLVVLPVVRYAPDCRSTCMRELMIWAVFSPETSPSTEAMALPPFL